ncbi:hypothetical protein QN397_22660 [Variovorax sp. RTB1]|uniref:hypothetical protein n=1 Tax=Variovorax sp. RTB1 TaxID=3048631 RepID=UPI002B23CE17|nr:hypothetical protein [Variovorax sp. RTB1]MEB0114095.1 hypothetical protein [Variovorax sp. RTB1]
MYKTLFDATVSKAFRLNEALLQKHPRSHKIEELTPLQKEIVTLCLAGGDPRQHPTVSTAARPADALSRYRASILRCLHVDIDIPWDRHQAMRHYELRQFLRFPLPYRPCSEIADWSFGKASWTAVIHRLDDAFGDAIARASILIPNRLSNLLDEEDD